MAARENTIMINFGYSKLKLGFYELDENPICLFKTLGLMTCPYQSR